MKLILEKSLSAGQLVPIMCMHIHTHTHIHIMCVHVVRSLALRLVSPGFYHLQIFILQEMLFLFICVCSTTSTHE